MDLESAVNDGIIFEITSSVDQAFLSAYLDNLAQLNLTSYHFLIPDLDPDERDRDGNRIYKTKDGGLASLRDPKSFAENTLTTGLQDIIGKSFTVTLGRRLGKSRLEQHLGYLATTPSHHVGTYFVGKPHIDAEFLMDPNDIPKLYQYNNHLNHYSNDRNHTLGAVAIPGRISDTKLAELDLKPAGYHDWNLSDEPEAVAEKIIGGSRFLNIQYSFEKERVKAFLTKLDMVLEESGLEHDDSIYLLFGVPVIYDAGSLTFTDYKLKVDIPHQAKAKIIKSYKSDTPEKIVNRSNTYFFELFDELIDTMPDRFSGKSAAYISGPHKKPELTGLVTTTYEHFKPLFSK